MSIKKTLKNSFVINGEVTISHDNFHLFIRIFALVVGLMHIGYFALMLAAGAGPFSYFNVASVIIYFTCFFLCRTPRQTANIFYVSFIEIMLFSCISTVLFRGTNTFPLLLLILIPLACLMKFWQDSIFNETLFCAGRMVAVVSVFFSLETIFNISFPEEGLLDLNSKYCVILNYYNVAISLLTVVLTGIAFTSVSVHVNRKSNDRYEILSQKLVQALSETVEAKDTYTKGHSARVAKYSQMIARRLDWSEESQKVVYYAGLLHDVGKIGIKDTIINKMGRLTDEEFETVKIHPLVGERILKRITEMPELMITAKYHHEHYDGRGYPEKLIGSNIPEIARLVCVADSYDAMTSNRSYRGLMEQEKVIEEIKKGLGTQFDPVFGQVMLDLISEDTEYTMHE